MWQGGISYIKYCGAFYDLDYKQSIRNRDHNICWTCCKTEKQNSRKLDVHHIDYNKQNCCPNNLISLCMHCHKITNTNRKWYTEWYQRIITKRLRR